MGLAQEAPLLEAEADAGAAGDSLQKKGFVVTSVDAVMNWARTGSLCAPAPGAPRSISLMLFGGTVSPR